MPTRDSVSTASDADYFRLRTEWLRFKGHVFDALTGLPALPAVMEEIRRLLESQRTLEVLYLDLGRSGWHETKLGWAAYDTAIKTFAGLLRALRDKGVLGPEDVICLHTVRSDRFLVFLRGEERVPGAPPRRDRVLGELQAALRGAAADTGLRSIRLAVGHARFNEHPMARSERGVQQAVSDAILMSLTAREGIEAARHAELSRLIVEGGVRTVFHPIVTLADPEGRGIGHEALTRVTRATSFDSVEELFAFAEATDLLVDFERLCRSVAIGTAPGLRRRELLFLNASAPAVLDPEWFSGAMDAILAKSGMTPRDVVVEITERLAVGSHTGFQG
ncbi:MAG: hypothetical protein ACHQNV_05955, partial [Vicinamibacteria bacterium]